MHEATRRVLSVVLRYHDGFETSEDVIVNVVPIGSPI